MSDTITKWHEMHDNNEPIPYHQTAQWVFIMDFTDGKAYRYDVSDIAKDSEVIEAFLHGAGHKLSNCEWMVTKNKDFINGN